MNVLLSIKPEYVEKIMEGEKRYEFRKNIFRKYSKVEKVYIYSTSPVKKIVGYFTFDDIIEEDPDTLWEKCKDHSGIDKEKFFKYYEGKKKGYAIKINSIKEFNNPRDPRNHSENFHPPQTFYYIDKNY